MRSRGEKNRRYEPAGALKRWHAKCYAEAVYPWEMCCTKCPLVFLNNLGILRSLPALSQTVRSRPSSAETQVYTRRGPVTAAPHLGR